MRRVHLVMIILVIVLILLAAIISTSRQMTSLEQIAAIFLCFLGGLAAFSEILGLLEKLGIPETILSSESKFVYRTRKPFETSVVLWGPTASGKSWLINAFAWNIQRKYKESGSGLEYKIIKKLDDFFPPDLTIAPMATEREIRISFQFERSKVSNDYYQSLSSFSHEIHLYDFPGESSIGMFDEDNMFYYTQNIFNSTDADIVIIVLDPTRITYTDLPDPEKYLYTQHQYAEMVRKLLNILEKADPAKQRLYAVCITKADVIPNSIYLHPDGLIEMFFGNEMLDALKIPPKENIQTFTTSSFGFLPGTTQANFDQFSQRIKNPESWQPYGVEYPFFWAFESQEKALLKNILSNGVLGKFTFWNKIRHYIPYPKPKYET